MEQQSRSKVVDTPGTGLLFRDRCACWLLVRLPSGCFVTSAGLTTSIENWLSNIEFCYQANGVWKQQTVQLEHTTAFCCSCQFDALHDAAGSIQKLWLIVSAVLCTLLTEWCLRLS